MLKEGDPAPTNIELQNQDGKLVKLTDYKGKKLVVYFYPKDNTPGCTTEAKNFRDSIKEYEDNSDAYKIEIFIIFTIQFIHIHYQ